FYPMSKILKEEIEEFHFKKKMNIKVNAELPSQYVTAATAAVKKSTFFSRTQEDQISFKKFFEENMKKKSSQSDGEQFRIHKKIKGAKQITSPTTIREIANIIKKLPRFKSPGLDGIT